MKISRVKIVEVVPYGTGRSFYVRVLGKALRTRDGKGPRLFRSESAARAAGDKNYERTR